ncbi:MAG: zinc ribbon domain-containing protein [Nannocystaceae bacterium]
MLRCPQCAQPNPLGSNFCEACGASMAEVAAAERLADEAEAEVMLERVRKARTALLIVAVFQVLGTVVMLAIGNVDSMTAGAMGILAAVFFGLAWWAKGNPFAAAVVGLVLFLSVHLADAVIDPSQIYKGIIVKVIVVVILVKSIRDGLAYRSFRNSRGL